MDAENARPLVLLKDGMAMAARMPMMTITISNSISVNPAIRERFMGEDRCQWKTAPYQAS